MAVWLAACASHLLEVRSVFQGFGAEINGSQFLYPACPVLELPKFPGPEILLPAVMVLGSPLPTGGQRVPLVKPRWTLSAPFSGCGAIAPQGSHTHVQRNLQQCPSCFQPETDGVSSSSHCTWPKDSKENRGSKLQVNAEEQSTCAVICGGAGLSCRWAARVRRRLPGCSARADKASPAPEARPGPGLQHAGLHQTGIARAATSPRPIRGCRAGCDLLGSP